MKKILALVLVLMLALSACTALADVTLTKVGDIENAKWAYNSSLMRVKVNDAYYIVDTQGNAISNETFSEVSYDSAYGYLVLAKNNGTVNRFGVMDAQGNTVVPYQYALIEVDAEWVVAIVLKDATSDKYDYTGSKENTYYLIDHVDVYSLTAGKCVATLPRENYTDARASGNVINIENRADGVTTAYDASFTALGTVNGVYDSKYETPKYTTYRGNGQYGVKDAQGNVIMEPSFYNIFAFYGDYAKVYTGEKYGLIDNKGNVIIPAEYDDIEIAYTCAYDPETNSSRNYNAAGYFGVVKGGKLGYVNAQGVVTCEPKYSEDILTFNGATSSYTDMEGNLHIMAADGVDTVITGYERVTCLNGSNGLFYRVNDADYNYGMIDWHGNVILPCQYDGIEFSADGKHLLVDLGRGKSELYSIEYDMGAAAPAPAAQEAPAAAPAQAEAQTASSLLGALGGAMNQQAAVQPVVTATPAPTAQAAPAAGANSGVIAIIDSAITLLNADPAANAATIKTLLETAKGML